MENFGIFVAGVIIGAVIVFFVNHFRQREVEKTFAQLSRDALRINNEEFLRLANQTLATQTQAGAGELEGKKKLIDLTLEGIKGELLKVEKSVADFDTKRVQAFGEISTKLQMTADQTNRLQDTTSKLELALSNTRDRGQWGERMAEDILQLVGFVENVNYTKQQTQESIGTRPDFTFKLPQNLKVNMDVKFPWDNYRNYLNAESAADKDSYKQKFISDARKKIKEVKTRDYINPSDNTVDYALMFIPNEQVFCFLHEIDAELLNDALKEKVILCSPVTLFAVLGVIRQAVDNFNLVQREDQILSLYETFSKQWGEFKMSMGKVGERIKQAEDEYGKLNATRTKALDRPLKQIDELIKQRGIVDASLVEEETTPEISTTDSNTRLSVEG